ARVGEAETARLDLLDRRRLDPLGVDTQQVVVDQVENIEFGGADDLQGDIDSAVIPLSLESGSGNDHRLGVGLLFLPGPLVHGGVLGDGRDADIPGADRREGPEAAEEGAAGVEDVDQLGSEELLDYQPG